MNSRLNRSMLGTIVLVLYLLSFATTSVSADTLVEKGVYIKDSVTFVINGENVEFHDPVLNQSGSLLLPMRNLYEAIGAEVVWDKPTLTASATRNGKSVDLTIDSKMALVNGGSVEVSVPPMLYKDRTYLPLRFVSENLDGTVHWDEESQTVYITLAKTPSSEENNDEPFILHMNNKKVVMDDPIIMKNGRSYIPADYFSQHLEGTSWSWISDQEYELQILGLSFVFTNDSPFLLVNEEPVLTDQRPFIQKGKMYVPVSFIIQTLGGASNVRYDSEAREMFIYIQEYMFSSDFLEKSYGSTNVPEPVPNARLEGTRQLLVSDNPEKLTGKSVPKSTATLAEHKITSTEKNNQHRIFGWHGNHLDTNITLGVTIENTSNQNRIKVTNAKGFSKISGNTWFNYDVGLPIAERVLKGNMKTLESNDIVIGPGETKVISSFQVADEYMIGFIQDFDIQPEGEGEGEYVIRTVLSKSEDADLTGIDSAQVRLESFSSHPRGAWPSSTIVADLPTFTIGDREEGYNLSNGKSDNFFTKENSFSTTNGTMGNPGHFGVVYKVNIPIVNPTGEKQKVKLKLAGRGGMYNGAVKINGDVYLVPTLRAGEEYVELPEYTITGEKDTITLEIMHAGGSYLPAAIYIE